MGKIKGLIFLIAAVCFQQQLMAQLPKVYLVDAAKVATIKKNAASNTGTTENIKQLSKNADKILSQHFGSVMDKKVATPCGNMHEYLSMAKYFWPDPSKPDGKPYIRKDGEKNPANDLVSDDKNFDALISAVNTLSWAYYFTNEEKYATKSIELIRFWFLDTATYMMPNLNHAQVRTGIDTGSNSGLIDTHNLPQVVDAIGLLRSSKQWKQSDEQGMKQWFSSYLHWLLNSKNGKKEAESKNNHGTFYDMQVVTIALFCGETDVADKKLQTEFARIANQIETDGKQPLELERTLALGYSIFNLEAWSLLATAAETKGVDLWHYQTADGRSIKKAIDYLLPYVTEGKNGSINRSILTSV
ncbi:MAG: alginate lyase family protein [Ferruginibacter sp.]